MSVIKKSYRIAAPSGLVFLALTNKDYIEEWSGDAAEIKAKPGGEFSLWDGAIVGKFTSISDTEISQDWKEEDWDAYSKVVFRIHAKGDSTVLEMEHTDVPEDKVESIDEGWDDYYLLPLKELVEDVFATQLGELD